MGIKSYITQTVSKTLFPRVTEYFEGRLRHEELRADYAQEGLTTIQLELENLTYQRLNQTHSSDYLYTRRHLNNIVELAVNMGYKNPITARTINVQADYVFGQGISFIAKHPWVQQVIDEFVNYRENRKALTSYTAMHRQEKRQQVYGSMFLALFTNRQTGRVIVRNLNTLEVDDVIRDPNDADKEWYIQHRTFENGVRGRVVYHPAYGITQSSGIPLPWNIKNVNIGIYEQGEIIWDAPVLHVAANRLGKEKFAIPEVYPQLDWAIAYKRFLEDWTSIMRAFARMAMKITGLTGKKQAAAAKSLLNTSTSLGNFNEKNPSPAGASTGLFGKDVNVEAVKTSGATTSASEGDSILNMAGCGVGLPNTFYGDAGKGNFATAKTLDRPTELKMTSRRKLWIEIFSDILDYAIEQSVYAPEGILALLGATYNEVMDPFDGQVVLVPKFPMNKDPQCGDVGEPIDVCYEVKFPELLERDVTDRVRALANAMTLFGKPLMDIIPDKRLVALWLMEALNIENAKDYIPSFVGMWKENQNVEPGEKATQPWIIPPPAPAGGGGAEDPSQGGDTGNNG